MNFESNMNLIQNLKTVHFRFPFIPVNVLYLFEESSISLFLW